MLSFVIYFMYILLLSCYFTIYFIYIFLSYISFLVDYRFIYDTSQIIIRQNYGIFAISFFHKFLNEYILSIS